MAVSVFGTHFDPNLHRKSTQNHTKIEVLRVLGPSWDQAGPQEVILSKKGLLSYIFRLPKSSPFSTRAPLFTAPAPLFRNKCRPGCSFLLGPFLRRLRDHIFIDFGGILSGVWESFSVLFPQC